MLFVVRFPVDPVSLMIATPDSVYVFKVPSLGCTTWVVERGCVVLGASRLCTLVTAQEYLGLIVTAGADTDDTDTDTKASREFIFGLLWGGRRLPVNAIVPRSTVP